METKGRKKRKKLSEMTPMEKMEKILKGSSWDEAEEVGKEILARCMALHIYAMDGGFEYIDHLIKSICERSDAWAHEDNNPRILALAAVGYKIEKGEYDKKTRGQDNTSSARHS